MNNDIFNKVDSIMIRQLEELDNLSTKDKEFTKKSNKARTICLIADKIIQSQMSQLKQDIWAHSKRFRMNANMSTKNCAGIEMEENDFLLENENV